MLEARCAALHAAKQGQERLVAHVSMALRVAAAGFYLVFASSCSEAADVYVSTDAAGAVRYATQALDPSYTLIYQEASTSGAQLPVAAPGAGTQDHQLRRLIERIADRHGVAAALVDAVIAVESGHNTAAISHKGAQGAMQLMPATAARYGVTAQSLRDPERNIDAGVRHLKDLLARHHGNVVLALAAYNAGSGAVDRHGARIPPYPETMLYVPAVLARALPAVYP